ncbi:MAG: class I SAM-dependent methyltransferase, partial [Opitutales bacterium]|nr:class I SAM-dependent methyltransferase [Opitutales bacterium]
MSKSSPSQNYIKSYPTDQNAIDIFKSEWSSKFPESFGIESGAVADLFDDQRIIWAEEKDISFKDKSILELGPLEAGHTWMMDQRGAREILAIEAHERAYLKCLVVKEIGKISSARFLHGNFDEYLTTNKQKFDICLASGVLYHSPDPTSLLEQICNCCGTIILWTHYFDKAEILKHGPELLERFKEPYSISYKELNVTHYP